MAIAGTEERYLNLLRQGLWGTADSQPSFGSMEEFLLARKQATPGLISRYSNRQEFRNEILFLKILRFSHISALSEIKRKLDSAGIQFVLLKGLGCDCYYPEPGLRDLGDIDIYVGEENYPRAALVLGCDCGKSGSTKHCSTTIEDVTVEIHRRCDDLPSHRADRYFQALAEEGLSNNLCQLDIEGIKVYAPSDNFNAVYLFIHFFNHFLGGGCGFRQVCDWVLFLHAKYEVLDRGYIASALRKLSLTNAWKTFGALAVRHLGLPEKEMPLFDARLSQRGDRLLRVILDMGNFGITRKLARMEKYGSGFFGKKFGSLLGAIAHSAEMLTLFPLHSLRYFLLTITSSTRKSLRQIGSASQRSWRSEKPAP